MAEVSLGLPWQRRRPPLRLPSGGGSDRGRRRPLSSTQARAMAALLCVANLVSYALDSVPRARSCPLASLSASRTVVCPLPLPGRYRSRDGASAASRPTSVTRGAVPRLASRLPPLHVAVPPPLRVAVPPPIHVVAPPTHPPLTNLHQPAGSLPLPPRTNRRQPAGSSATSPAMRSSRRRRGPSRCSPRRSSARHARGHTY